MAQGNWNCGKCGAEINDLPFEPDPSRIDQLLCRDCHRKKRDSSQGGSGGGFQGGQRQMYQGNWTCADCGTAITQLPFEPNPDKTGNLRCLDCFKKSRSNTM